VSELQQRVGRVAEALVSLGHARFFAGHEVGARAGLEQGIQAGFEFAERRVVWRLRLGRFALAFERHEP
jgi:hypothetical protein